MLLKYLICNRKFHLWSLYLLTETHLVTSKQYHHSATMEKEIVRTLKQMRNNQANEICAIQKKLEESRLQTMKSYNNALFNIYADIKRIKGNLPLLSRNKHNLASKLSELKNTTIRIRKNLNDDILELSEEAIRLEAMISEDLKIIKKT